MAEPGVAGLSPELIKLLSSSEGSTESNWIIFKEILDTRKDLQETLLQLLYSSTLKEDERVTPEGRRIPITRLARLPDEKRICPKCKAIKDDYLWEMCNPKEEVQRDLRLSELELDSLKKRIAQDKTKGIEADVLTKYRVEELEKKIRSLRATKPKHSDSVATLWLNWKPPLSDVGFSKVLNAILTSVNKNLRLGNLKADANIINYALGIAGDVDEMIVEHPEWQCEGAKFTRSERVMLESTIAQNIRAALSMGLGAILLERLTQNTQRRELTTSGEFAGGKKDDGILGKLGKWITS
jgi:hypothetical protein